MDFFEGALLVLLGYAIARLLHTIYRLIPSGLGESDRG